MEGSKLALLMLFKMKRGARLKRELPYDPAIPLLGIYPEKTIILKAHLLQFSCGTVYNSQGIKAT